MRAKELREHCEVNGSTKELLKAAINQFGLSGRGYDRILKVSRTIADLESCERIEMHHKKFGPNALGSCFPFAEKARSMARGGKR